MNGLIWDNCSSEDFFSLLEERSHSTQVAGNVILESFNNVQSSRSFLSLFFVLGELFSAPDILDSQSFLLVFELELIVFKGFGGSFDDGLVLDD
jgi:hypothetical protein